MYMFAPKAYSWVRHCKIPHIYIHIKLIILSESWKFLNVHFYKSRANQTKVRILQRLFKGIHDFSSSSNPTEKKVKISVRSNANKLINNDNFKQSLFLYISRDLKYRKWFPFLTVVAVKRIGIEQHAKVETFTGQKGFYKSLKSGLLRKWQESERVWIGVKGDCSIFNPFTCTENDPGWHVVVKKMAFSGN